MNGWFLGTVIALMAVAIAPGVIASVSRWHRERELPALLDDALHLMRSFIRPQSAEARIWRLSAILHGLLGLWFAVRISANWEGPQLGAVTMFLFIPLFFAGAVGTMVWFISTAFWNVIEKRAGLRDDFSETSDFAFVPRLIYLVPGLIVVWGIFGLNRLLGGD